MRRALSFIVSMLSLLLIRTDFRVVQPPVQRGCAPDIARGLRWLWHSP